IYIIGLVLFFNKDFDKSIELLSRLLLKFKSKKAPSQDDKIAVVNILILLHSIYRSRLRELKLWPGSENIVEDIQIAKQLIIEMKNCDLSIPALLMEAQVAFAERDIPRAKTFAQRCLSNLPNDPAPYFSLAFLSYYENDLVGGFKYLFGAFRNNPF